MTCGVCGIEVTPIAHRFYEGRAVHDGCDDPSCAVAKPAREWFVYAPLYFKPTDDGEACDVPFCGPACATAYARQALAEPEGE